MWLPSPAGLRLEIRCETDKKKMNFIFNRDEKIFLTRKMMRACPSEKKKSVFGKIFARVEPDAFEVAATN